MKIYITLPVIWVFICDLYDELTINKFANYVINLLIILYLFFNCYWNIICSNWNFKKKFFQITDLRSYTNVIYLVIFELLQLFNADQNAIILPHYLLFGRPTHITIVNTIACLVDLGIFQRFQLKILPSDNTQTTLLALQTIQMYLKISYTQGIFY